MTRRVHAERSNCELMRANVSNAAEDEFWQRRRKRNAHDAFQSNESAEADVNERARRNCQQKKQRAHLKSRRGYNGNDGSLLNVEDCHTTQSKKQPKKVHAREKYCVRAERSHGRIKRQHYPVSSGDSDTATLTVTESTDASTSSSTSSMRAVGRYKMGTKYRSYDDLERANYARGKSNLSDDCVPPKRLACESTPNHRTTSKSANEMLQFVSNLFQQLGNTNSSMPVNADTIVGVHGDVSAQRGMELFDNAVNQRRTPLKSTLQFAVSDGFGRQLSGAETGNPAMSQNLPAATAQLQQKNYYQNYSTKTQAECAPTSRAHVVTAGAPTSQQLHAPRTYVTPNLTPTVQPVQFAATQQGAHYTQVQGNVTTQSGAPAALQFDRRGAYGQETIPAPPIQSLEYVNRFQSEPQEFVLSRVPIVPHVVSSTCDENLVSVTYITPQPTEMPPEMPTAADNRVTGISSSLMRNTNLRTDQHYPTSFIYTGSDSRLRTNNLIEYTNDTAAAKFFAHQEHPTTDVRQAETQTSNFSAKLDVIAAASYSDTHLLPGKITRPNIRAYAVDQILLPIIETQLEQTVNDRRSSANTRSSADMRNSFGRRNSVEASQGETSCNAGSRRNSQRESMNRTESIKREEAKPRRCKGKMAVQSDGSSDEEGTSSSCNSDYIRACLRKRRHKKKCKEAERSRTHRKQCKHYRCKDSYESDSNESSDDYEELGRKSSRSQSKRRKRYVPYTPNGSESDDEMEDSFSKTSCKKIKKCCGRIVAICRKARDTAGTQTDDCCDCAPKAPKKAQCSCKLEKDIQRQICESLANAEQSALRKIAQRSKEKKKCRVYACGAVGEDGAPQMQDDMIIIKFEEEDEDAKCSARTQEKCEESATRCKSDCNCKTTESEAEMIKALIRKKRVFDKIKKACSLTSVRSERCTCADQADEAEYMEDLLRQKRLERTKKSNCACDMDDKAREMATEVLKGLIGNHIRSMCAAEMANKASSSASECFAKCFYGLKGEERNYKQQFGAQKKMRTNSSSESCAPCVCGFESEPKIVRKSYASSSNESCAECLCGRAPKIRPSDCTCNPNQYERNRSNTMERKLYRYNRNEEYTCADDCACSVDRNEYRSAKPKPPPRAWSSSSSLKVSAKKSDKLSERDACCTCNERNNEKETTKVKPDRSQKLLEIEISTGGEQRALKSVREVRSNARNNTCTCESPSESKSAQRKPKRTQRSQYSDDSEMSVRAGGCTCKPSNQNQRQIKQAPSTKTLKPKRTPRSQYSDDSEMSVRAGGCTCKPSNQNQRQIKQAPSTKTLKANKSGNAGLRGKRDASENKSSAKRVLSKTSTANRNDFSGYETQTCRSDCACKGAPKYKSARSQENASENMRDYEERRKPTTPSAKASRDLETGRRAEEFAKTCRSDCACKQTFGQRELSDSADDIEERTVARRKNMAEQSSEDDESLGECNEQKSIQKLIIDIKAGREACASCTVITYPQSIKTNQRSKSFADGEQSANVRNRQTAALCTELALNDLMPQHSLRTLLTKLSSPNGKLFGSKGLDTSSVPDHDINTFLMDQSKVLSLKTGRNGEIKPTMIMSQAIRVTGNKSNTTQNGAHEPLQYYRKKVLKLSSSAPSLVLTTDYANNSQAKPETSKSKPKVKKSLIPLPARSHGGKHSNATKPPALMQSESAETRANTRPYINHAGESNTQITRLWPEQQRAHEKKLKRSEKNYERNWRNKRAADMNIETESIAELCNATCDRATSISASYRLESGTALSFDKSTPSSSSTTIKQGRTKNKRKLSSSAKRRAPMKIGNILNESQLYAKRSNESNKSSISQKPERKQNNMLRKIIARKAAAKHHSGTPTMYSSHSIDYIERQSSTTILPTSSKKRRVTRFSIAKPEQRSDSEVECSSLDDMDSRCDEYELELERKGKLWREGTVRQALEVEELESERNRHWQRTTLTGESLERAINYPTSVWNEERKQLNMKRNGGGIFGPF